MPQELAVLIVDDSRSLCLYLQSTLLECGVQRADYCLSAEEALKKKRRSEIKYDAIIIDLHMDGMDGLQLIHTLNEELYRGAIIVMSALDQKILEFTIEVISKYNLWVLGSIHKPFDKSTISFVVKRLRNRRVAGIAQSDEPLLSKEEIALALERFHVVPYFQPKVNPALNQLMGIEVLCRLIVGNTKIVKPAAFMSVVERSGLLTSLMITVMEIALPQYRDFCIKQKVDCKLAINLSPAQLLDDNLPDVLLHLLSKYDVEPSSLIIEITENLPLRVSVQSKNINRLRIKGMGISLDDYGSGYTNLRQLKSMPFTEVKLDRSVVHGIGRDQVLTAVAKSVLEITNQLGIPLVAEGIEDAGDLAVLDQIGVKQFQGFLFCRPKPVEELARWHGAWKKVANHYLHGPH